MFRFFKKQESNVIDAKQKELDGFSQQFDSAVSLVTGVISGLHTLSEKVSAEIQEIDDYQSKLSATRDGLCKMKEKNDKIAANLRQLIEA